MPQTTEPDINARLEVRTFDGRHMSRKSRRRSRERYNATFLAAQSREAWAKADAMKDAG